ncbi:TetR/AcrR family transcriptional regulator [Alkalibacterium pelagium]|uniref:Transcriptional regulator, TetR family n=1 Tax=Alkalibacterium pelagium TaxID=426702 RepID=A0A1H7FC78_9LACT|nr:TetR/AcrR family transcriptional regulator [Alkalibacterium pelagium]GEN49402.1 TetR family transcriptional regulator [Alkalibacterium pelagium]SEK23706.1 transcriptional regulator, TetR family [Alkalibacterium pelagium]
MSKKREAIVEQAENLFYNEGFHAVGIKRIVYEANVSIMTLYNHFESKEQLIIEVLNQRQDRYLSSIRQRIEQNESSNSKQHLALAIAEAHIKWLKANKNGCLFLRAKEEYSLENKEISSLVESHKSYMLNYLEELGLTEGTQVQVTMLLEGATSLSVTFDLDKIEDQLIRSIKRLID